MTEIFKIEATFDISKCNLKLNTVDCNTGGNICKRDAQQSKESYLVQ